MTETRRIIHNSDCIYTLTLHSFIESSPVKSPVSSSFCVWVACSNTIHEQKRPCFYEKNIRLNSHEMGKSYRQVCLRDLNDSLKMNVPIKGVTWMPRVHGVVCGYWKECVLPKWSRTLFRLSIFSPSNTSNMETLKTNKAETSIDYESGRVKSRETTRIQIILSNLSPSHSQTMWEVESFASLLTCLSEQNINSLASIRVA